ncbi:MAG: hypothetical protein EXS63_03240 [Candidatus Omnitrophica bacterium]|nr:hypothetical protein [Candidatus Omnitrophota bacterium]
MNRISLGGILLALIFEIPALSAAPILVPISSQSAEKIHSGSGVIDVSDRQYMSKLRELFNFSRKQIDISLTQIVIRDEKKDAVNILLEDLVSAVKRGVRVRMFLNTFTDEASDQSLFLREDKLAYLEKEGMQIHFVNPKYRLSDQLAVVDEAMVLEGGPAWSHENLTEGLGSASLSYSLSLAQKKRTRMEFFPLWDLKVEKESRTVGELAVPVFLLQDVKYFPGMVSSDDGDAIKIYLFLLEKFYEAHQNTLKVSLEELSHRIPSDRTIDRMALDHQVDEVLRRLSNQYKLLTIQGEDPSHPELTLKLPVVLTPNVQVSLTLFHENYVKDFSARAIYAYFVIRYRLQMSGESPVWVGSERNVEKDFPIPREQFRLAVDELRRQNLVEIFPFNLRQGSGYVGADILEYRYLINEIPTLSERLDTWSRFRDQFGDTDFERARAMAETLGEPEDPKVVAAYLKLLGQYSYTDVQALTQHLNTLPVNSTPNQLSYLQQLLRNETQGTQGLATT